MTEPLKTLTAERDTARLVFIAARFRRDAAARTCDSLLAGGTGPSGPVWAALRRAQEEMDVAGERLYCACDAIAALALGPGGGPGRPSAAGAPDA